MAVKNPTTINLIVGRQERTIFINSILYAEVQDKLCTIHLTKNETLSVFLSIASLAALLPEKAFLRASRNCLVALQYIQYIDETDIILFNADRIPYSRRRKTSVYQAFQEYLSSKTFSEKSTAWALDLYSEFSCFNHCPYAFCIFEVSVREDKGMQEFYVRYANDAIAAALRMPLSRLINTPLSQIVGAHYGNLFRMVARTALAGGHYDQFWHERSSNRLMHVAFYQPHYGFCACMFIPTTEEQMSLSVLPYEQPDLGGALSDSPKI